MHRLLGPPNWPAVALLVALVPSWTGAWAAPDCFAATDALAEREWEQARVILSKLADEPECIEHRSSIRYSLAYVLEQQAATNLTAACEAMRLYDGLAIMSEDRKIAAAAKKGAVRAGTMCEIARRTVDRPASEVLESALIERAPAEEIDDSTPTWLLVGASAAVVGGGTLIWFATEADAEREAAEADMRAHHAAGDADGVAAGEARFVDAADRTNIFAVSGYTALAAGIGLGIGAIWTWSTRDGPSVAASPGRIAIRGRY